MKEKFAKVLWYISLLLSQPSTWRGVCFIIGLFTGHQVTGDWGQAAAIGGSISALLKMVLPDSITAFKLPVLNEEKSQ